MSAPNTTNPLPYLIEGRDGIIQIIRKVNQLARSIGNVQVGTGAAKIAYALPSTENILGLPANASEQFLTQRAVPYSIFASTITFFVSVFARVQAGTATWFLRLGGADSTVSGTVLGSASVTSAAYPAWTPISIQATAARGTLTVTDYIKVTQTNTAGTAQIREGTLVLS